MEDSNCRLSKRFLHCPVTLPPTNQKKVTYPAVLNPNFTYKNFSLKTTGQLGDLEYEPPILFGWPWNKLFFPTPTPPTHKKARNGNSNGEQTDFKTSRNNTRKKWNLKNQSMVKDYAFNILLIHTHTQTYIPGNWKQIWKRCIHSHIYCMIAKRWKQPKTPTERWMDREKVICTHSRVLALQKEILSHGFHPTTWMKLKDSMLSKIKVKVFSCLTLCDPKDCSPPGSHVHGILQARILEWVVIPFSRGSSWPRQILYCLSQDKACMISFIAGI